MRILMTLMALDIGGAETHVIELSKELKRRGHDVVVASNGGVLLSTLDEARIEHLLCHLDKRNIFNIISSYHKLNRYLRNNHFDIIHSHARIPSFVCKLLTKKFNLNFVSTAHWVFKTGCIVNALSFWGEEALTVSEDIKDYLISNYDILPNKITVTINGIDTLKYTPEIDGQKVKKEFNMRQSNHRIVYVSRIDTDRSKIALELIVIAHKLYEIYNDFELVIVGGGNDFNNVKFAAEMCNDIIGKRIIIITNTRTDVQEFIACADLFIGVSRSALEAMSAARPVIIAGNEGYIGVFVSDKVDISIRSNFCCRGCVMANTDLLFQDIVKFFEKSTCEKELLGNYCRKFVLKNYSIKKMADDCERVYSKFCSK